jgi:hypothetical protein
MGNADRLIQEAADLKAATAFVTDFIRRDNLKERQVEGLGIAISQWSKWDGIKILHVFYSALSDANFHHEAEQVKKMIEEVEAL